MADQHYEDAIVKINELLASIEARDVPLSDDDTSETIRDGLLAVAEKLTLLRDRMLNNETAYEIGGDA